MIFFTKYKILWYNENILLVPIRAECIRLKCLVCPALFYCRERK
nr:MAG TPA: hypothetical protein [Caudoviricetes sp.]